MSPALQLAILIDQLRARVAVDDPLSRAEQYDLAMVLETIRRDVARMPPALRLVTEDAG